MPAHGTDTSHQSERAFNNKAGALAFRAFCTPELSTHRSADHDQLVKRARVHLEAACRARVKTSVGELECYVLNPDHHNGASVLMVHGWTAEASFMSAFADHLRRRGFRIVLFDCPAHGQSARRHTSLMDVAHGVREVAEALGPIDFVTAHSMGGLAALLAAAGGPPMPRRYPFNAFVLVSMPDRFSDVTRTFGAEHRLSAAAQREFERRLERIAHRKIADFTGSKLLRETGAPALLLNATDDEEVPSENAKRIAAAHRTCDVELFDGLGHRKILYAPHVIRTASAYLLDQWQSA